MKKLALLVAALVVAGLSAYGTAALSQDPQLPIISVEPASYDFGSVPVGAIGQGAIVVYNTGGTTLSVTAVKTKAPFNDGATSFTVPPGGSRRVSLSFAPQAAGTYEDVCTIQSNASNTPVLNVPLTGTGVE